MKQPRSRALNFSVSMYERFFFLLIRLLFFHDGKNHGSENTMEKMSRETVSLVFEKVRRKMTRNLTRTDYFARVTHICFFFEGGEKVALRIYAADSDLVERSNRLSMIGSSISLITIDIFPCQKLQKDLPDFQ